MHPYVALLKSTLLQVFGGLGVELAELFDDTALTAHELADWDLIVNDGPDCHIGIETVKNLVVSEDVAFCQVHEDHVLLGKQVDAAESDEEDLTELLAHRDYFRTRRELTSVHLDDEFISETFLARIKKLVKLQAEHFERIKFLHDGVLHLGSQPLVHFELFNNKVEILQKCVLDKSVYF
jgi:hypothetical protein